MPRGPMPRRFGGWLTLLFGGVLAIHFLFLLALAKHVSIVAVLLFVAGAFLVVPHTRQRIERLPGLSRRGLRVALFFGAVALATALLAAGDRADLVRQPTAFVGATVLTGLPDAEPIRDAVVLVDGTGRIEAVGPASATPVAAGYRVVDLAGKHLMPGLINAHGHLLLTGRAAGEPVALERFALPEWLVGSLLALMRTYPGERLVLRQMERNAERAVRAGVTTLRALGDPNYVDVRLRKRIEGGRSVGPRLLVAGPILCVTGGHAHQIGREFDGPDEARRAVRYSLRREVDLIKIANTGGVADARRIGEAGELQMTPEEIEAVVDEAHRKNVMVAAHAESALGVLEALRAGVDTVEHGADLDAEAISLFNDNPRALRGYTTLHPTLSVVAGSLELTDAVREDRALYVMYANGNRIKQSMIRGYRDAVAGGVKIGVGTDAGIVRHDDVWKEMAYFVEHGGISTALALYWGTLGTAESIGVDGFTGSVEPGKFADFVVVEDDPIRDLSTLAAPAMVVAAGVVLDPGE